MTPHALLIALRVDPADPGTFYGGLALIGLALALALLFGRDQGPRP